MIDHVMPRWHYRERHQLPVNAAAAQVMSAIDDTTWADLPLSRWLFGIASLGRLRRKPGQSMVADMLARGFVELGRNDHELVLGAVSRPEPETAAPCSASEAFYAFARPGQTKAAFNLRFESGMLITETRVIGTDDRGRLLFLPYWLLIRLPSGLVRREALLAVRRRAEGRR